MTTIDLNIEDLLQPIPGDLPAGEPTPFAIRNSLEEKRKEIDPESFAPDDPARPAEAKLADWPGIVAVACNSLQTVSKDLLVAARLTEALTHVHGFAGLREGLRLFNRLVRECWDRLHPDISDGDLEVRAGPFNWLSDANRGARFPNTVRQLRLLNGPNGGFSWRHWKAIQEKRGNKEEFDRAVAAVSREACAQNLDVLNHCLAEFSLLTEGLAERLGNEAPAMVDLRSALVDCQTLMRMIVQEKGPDDPAAATGSPPAAADGSPGGAGMAGSSPVTSRAEIYRRLKETADALERLEPHSPIPYLLRRAVELGNMTFPQLIKELLAGGGNLDTINKEFGIKPRTD